MTFEEIKDATLNLDGNGQKRLVMELLPAIWPKVCLDEECLIKVRELVDEATVKSYYDQHMDHI